MRQKTQKHRNQGSIEKKNRFFLQSLCHIPRWVCLVQKTRLKKSHAWAPLTWILKILAQDMIPCTDTQTYMGQCWESVTTREFWMSYRGPGFIAVVWFGSSPAPSHSPVSKLYLFISLPACRRGRAYWRERGRRGWGWSQIMWQRESLALYKSFNTLCSPPSEPNPLSWSSRDSFACVGKRTCFHPTLV